MNSNQKYIQRCIQLAKNGLSTTYPNPMVGCVVVYNDNIIGEGWHYQAGKPHAEVNAINSVSDKSLLPKATIYVSLEPCSHFGKTPPCADLIINSGIKKVVIGTIDPFAKVAGNGVKKLKDAGCKVTVGVLEKECNELNKRFFTFHNKKRPYIYLKWASSADGFLSPKQKNREPVWITNTYSKQWVHKLRANEQAILIGTETAIKDNPKLNTRLWHGNCPLRVILDLNNRISKDSHIFDESERTLIISSEEDKVISSNLFYIKITKEQSLVEQICRILHRLKIQSLIVEGGAKMLQTFIDANLWDEAFLFSNKKTYFKEGTKAPYITSKTIQYKQINTDILTHYTND